MGLFRKLEQKLRPKVKSLVRHPDKAIAAVASVVVKANAVSSTLAQLLNLAKKRK
jgi:hypothetical protein